MADAIEYRVGDKVKMTKAYLATYCGALSLQDKVGEVAEIAKGGIPALWVKYEDNSALFLVAVDGVEKV
jgi:hypothetical protein